MVSTRRLIRSDLILLLTISLAACGGGDSAGPGGGDSAGPDDSGNNPAPPPPANAVSVADNYFDPSSLTVSVGATVTWTWIERADAYTGVGPNAHTVTFSDGVESSGTQSSGTHTRQFDQTGSFEYFCNVHGAAAMSGTIVVQ